MWKLIALIGSALITAALLVWARRGVRGRLALIASYALTLALAMRFGALTYPGVWMGDAGWLNNLFNGSEIFWLGMDMIAVAVAADLVILLIAWRFERPGMASRAAVWTRNAALTTASLIALYGFYWAALMERLPA
ncbi:MAG: hypothetical protein JSR45_14960 [Proteobacteria bacterium]|nr:hypothetical protein [Pseudomonadota bacterium]